MHRGNLAALAPSPFESLESAEALRVSVAGAESNMAMYLADLGIPVSWLSALGDDALGRRVRAAVGAAGVDISGVRWDPERPNGLLVKEPAGPRTHVHFDDRVARAQFSGQRLEVRLGTAQLNCCPLDGRLRNMHLDGGQGRCRFVAAHC